MKQWLGLGLLLLAACGGKDADSENISARDADTSECPNGGTVFLISGQPKATVCNGLDGAEGPTGKDGAEGAVGPVGPAGQDAAVGETELMGGNALDAKNVVADIAENADAFVIVECTADGSSYQDGSGTKTTSGTVLTAQHVVQGMDTCKIYSQAPVTLLGTVTDMNQRGSEDQVELSMHWTHAGDAIVGLTPVLGAAPALGDFVVVVGNPGVYDGIALEHQYTTGFVTAVNLDATFAEVPSLEGHDTSWHKAWSTDAVSWHGNSGGPVFNEDREWVGMLVGAFNGASDNEGPDLSVVIPIF
jgi:hypothetical protein